MEAPIWVIIPTYNEAANLEPIVAPQRRARPRRRRRLPDPDRRRRLARRNRQIADRSQRAAGRRCCIAPTRPASAPPTWPGFSALDAGAQLVIEMDADFSHDPRYLPASAGRGAGADLVLGSRYVAGGGVRDWGLATAAGQPRRRHLRACDPRRRVHDLTGGFKCIRREVLEAIDLPSIRPRVTCSRSKSPTAPYWPDSACARSRSCSPTASPASKMSTRIALEAIWRVPSSREARRSERCRGRAATPETIARLVQPTGHSRHT